MNGFLGIDEAGKVHAVARHLSRDGAWPTKCGRQVRRLPTLAEVEKADRCRPCAEASS